MREPLDIAKPFFDDREFVSGILEQLPIRWAFGYAKKYNQILNDEKQGRREANLYLLEKRDSLKVHPVGLGASDDEIQSAAKAKAKHYQERISQLVKHELSWLGVEQNPSVQDWGVLYKEIEKEIKPLGVKAPPLKTGSTYESLCRRFACPVWWRRALRVAVNRHVEHEAIKAGLVGFKSNYVSNETLKRREQQNRRNSQLLEFIEAENDAGYKASLAELSAAGVSNPVNRKNELMVRIRGLEEEAKRKGLVCEFYTLTCPSKYHATSNGRPNPKYNGESPKQAQKYLSDIYSRIRAKLHRNKLNPVGFRVAEPHKDACPHWHFLLFIEKSNAAQMRAIFREHALKEDGDERGAYLARFKPVRIDPNKGSAAGYIAKYIAKNVSMDGLDDFDRDGKSASDGLLRSVAWAATWGIHQFQEIGNKVIGKWRELRRIRDEQDLPECVKPLWRAADAGEYAAFLRELMGRKVEYLRETEKEMDLYKKSFIPDEKSFFGKQEYIKSGVLVTGLLNRYGEPALGAVKGLIVDKVEVITRFFKWSFSYKEQGLPEVDVAASFKGLEMGEVKTTKQKSSRKALLVRAAHGMNGFFSFSMNAKRSLLGLV